MGSVCARTLRGGDNPEVGQVLASVHVIEMDPVPGAFPLQELDQALRKSGEGTRLLGREVSKKPRPNHPGVGGRVFQRLRWWIWGQGCASVGQAGKATGTQHPAGAAARSFHLEPTGERDALEFEWASTRRVPISSALFGTRLGDGRVGGGGHPRTYTLLEDLELAVGEGQLLTSAFGCSGVCCMPRAHMQPCVLHPHLQGIHSSVDTSDSECADGDCISLSVHDSKHLAVGGQQSEPG